MHDYKTKQRRVMLDYLRSNADESFCAAQIADALAGQGISISAVYRNLASMEKQGVIHRIVKSGGKQVYYRYSGAEACRDHLHVSCVKCGCTFHVDESTTDEIIKSVKSCAGFRVDSSSTVIYGVCDKCEKTGKAGAV